MKILITGSSGYIGSHLCKILSKDPDINVYGLDKKPTIFPLENFALQNITENNYWLYEINQLEFDCVVHLAAEVSVPKSVGNPIPYYRTNIIGTLNLLRKIKTKTFIYGSTGSAAHLNNPYSLSKKAAEEIVEQHCKNNSINFSIVRFNNVLGSDDLPIRQDTILAKLKTAIDTGVFNIYGTDYNTKDGTCERDYTHVIDVCNGIKSLIDQPSNQLEEFGSGKATSVKEIITEFKYANGCDFDVMYLDRRQGDVARSVVSIPSRYFRQENCIKDLVKINEYN